MRLEIVRPNRTLDILPPAAIQSIVGVEEIHPNAFRAAGLPLTGVDRARSVAGGGWMRAWKQGRLIGRLKGVGQDSGDEDTR